MIPDSTYMTDAVVWLLAWTALGLTARQLIANGDARREHRRQHNEKAAR